MSTPVTIFSSPPARTSMDYAALRERGMELIRRWASESWTDHNVHDPGITILEACSYAMTELGLRLQLDVADLIRSGESQRAPDFQPAHRVLSVGPVNARDWRSVLLDHPSVGEAQVFLPAASEVPLYERPGGDPPLTYTSGTARVRLGGLYEVLVEFGGDDAKRELNSSTYSLPITSGGQTYDIDLALPFWDEAEAAPFREGATVSSVSMVPDGGEVWKTLPEPNSFFGKLEVGFTGPGGAGSLVTWVVLQITTVLPQPAVVVPGILAAARARVESTATDAPVTRFADRVGRAVIAVKELGNYLEGWRNLGEQAVRIGVARVQEIALRARIEVTGGIDIEQLLATVLADVEQTLSPRARFESLASRRHSDTDSDAIYDGPLLRNGFLAADSAAAAHPAVIYLSDVLRTIMKRRSGTRSDVVTQENPVGRDIVAVTDLALTNFINNRPITSDAEDCLHLVEIERYRPRLSIVKSRIVVVRNESEVNYDLARVERLFTELLTQAEKGSRTEDTSSVWLVPRGDPLPVDEYTPLQEDLPGNYSVGHSMLPDSAGPKRRAAVRQLRGYLLLFEQLLADVAAQLGNINRFFSADAGESTTYFTRPLFDIPGVPEMLKRSPSDGEWAGEGRTQMLDRRNRMLDHLLARQGEDTVALGQELHRWAQVELAAGNLPPNEQTKRIAERRDGANARLMRIKAALLHDAPELNAFRLLAKSNPLARDATLLRIESTEIGFRWHLSLVGTERLRSVRVFETGTAASIDGENALEFAARSTFYDVVNVGGGKRRLKLRDGTADAQQRPESSNEFDSVAEANAALQNIAAECARLRIESLAPLERRIAYLAGIRSELRRRLLVPTNVLFEIVDDPAEPGLFGKRWRLWERPGKSGEVLLNSPSRFQAGTDAAATALAQQSIRQVLRLGMDEWNYRTEPKADSFVCELRDSSGAIIGIRESGLTSEADAERAREASVDTLYRNYSVEGCSLIEHLLLRPRRAGEPFLSLPAGDTARERDPYSHRLSIIFPSGLARDLSLSRATAPTTLVTPDRFRDPEFRRHTERVIEQACPAHLLATVYWVDQSAPGTPASAASFDAWEERYFAWLDTVLIPGAPAGSMEAARTAMVETLNAIAADAP